MFVYLGVRGLSESAVALRVCARPSLVRGEAPEFLGYGVGPRERLEETVAL